MKFSFFLVILGLFLNGCGTTPIVLNKDAVYRQKAGLRLKVKTVDIVNSYVAPEKAPYIDHLLTYSLSDYLIEWGHHRLLACAPKGFAVVTIEQVSITQKPLAVKKGIMDTFTRFPSSILEAIAAVRIDFMDYKGYPQGYATARTKQSMTILENVSPSEQQVIISNLSKIVTDAIDQEIEKSLKKHASTVLLPTS